jgi:cellulose synthase (UDP-forming)
VAEVAKQSIVSERAPVPPGKVAGPNGQPAIAPGPAPGEPAERVASVREIAGRDVWIYRGVVVAWITATLVFWIWWLQPGRPATLGLFIIFTLAFGYEVTTLPSIYLYFVGRMRRPVHMEPTPGLRVALITLCVPSSESLEVIIQQLEALTRVHYPHESWVLDEGDDPDVRAAAARLGVRYFTRKGIERYNQPEPPFKAKTKAGNVNAWLDSHGQDYDFFVQYDIDHIPRPDYLDRVLGYFRDPRIAWVQAPSVYGNTDRWVARGAAEQELVLQGPLQQGFYGSSETPFIIGSHCTYRMAAVDEIGGFQPTRAEDHLDTLMLASRGYRGVFVPEVIALGRGPDTFETYLRQQFAWAYSLIEVFFKFTPRLLRGLTLRQAQQFIFAQTWYMRSSSGALILFLIPLVVLTSGRPLTEASFLAFLAAAAPLLMARTYMWWWSRKWHQPKGMRLTWRGVVLHVARWPIVFWAFLNVVFRVKHPYMITPKQEREGVPAFSLKSQMLYLFFMWLSLGVVWLYGRDAFVGFDPASGVERAGSVGGQVFWALWGALFMFAVVQVNVFRDLVGLRRLGIGLLRSIRLRWVPLAVTTASVALFLWTAYDQSRDILAAMTWRPTSGSTAGAPAPIPPPVNTGGPTAAMPLPTGGVSSGAYDPSQAFAALPLVVEHWFVPQDQPEMMSSAMAHARNSRTLLVTVEPFPLTPSQTDVLEAVVRGDMDADLRRLAEIVVAGQPQEALVRWAHEMELTGLYPWATNQPELYQAAFRHVVEVFRAEGATNARWVWSPAGDDGAQAFYPGDDVVDYIGMTVLEDAAWDAAFGRPPQSFLELAAPRYDRLAPFGKPVMVAELGVSGTPPRQQSWLEQAAQDVRSLSEMVALVYFNALNAPVTALPTRPDWRVPASSFAPFVAALPPATTASPASGT